MRLLSRALLLSFMTLAACNSGLSQPWQLTDFRVLGIKADPAEVSRGSNTTVSLAYADTINRPLQVLWLACRNPISLTSGLDGGTGGLTGTFGGSTGCSLVTMPGTPVPDFGTTVTVHVPMSGGALDTSGNEVLYIVGFACAGGTIGEPADGGTQPSCNANGSTPARGWMFTGAVHVHGPRAVFNPPNQNPQISEVRFGMAGALAPITMDAPPTVPRCTDTSRHPNCMAWQFEVGFTDGSRETYVSVDPLDGGHSMSTEQLNTHYVIDQGTLAGDSRSDSDGTPMATMSNTWTAPATAGDAHVFLYAIDGRGGFDWTERVIHVQ